MKLKKLLVLAAMLAVIVAAAALNFWYSKGDSAAEVTDVLNGQSEDKILGEALFVNGEADTETAAAVKEDYFTTARMSRQQARDESCELLKSIAADKSNTEEVRKKAAEDLAKVADAIERESNIESLVVAKGFEQCLAIVSENSVNIMVTAQGLTEAELAQINEIVVSETGLSGSSVKIVEIN